MMKQNRQIADANLLSHIVELMGHFFRLRSVSPISPVPDYSKVGAVDDLRRPRLGYVRFSSLIEILLICLLIFGAAVAVPQLLQSLDKHSADKPARPIEPTLRLTRTLNDRLWFQVANREIASVDLNAQNHQIEFRTPGPPIFGSKISRDGATFMVSLLHQEIQIFRNHEVIVSHQVPEGDSVQMDISAGGTTALVLLGGNKVHWYDLSNSTPTWTDYEIPKAADRTALFPSGTMFVATTKQGEMDLFDAKTGVRVKSWSDIGLVTSDLVFSDDGNLLAFAGMETMNLYDMRSLSITWQSPLLEACPEHHVAITHDGQLIAVANARTGIQVLNGASGDTVCALTTQSYARSLDFSLSGDALYSTLSDGSIRTWSLVDKLAPSSNLLF